MEARVRPRECRLARPPVGLSCVSRAPWRKAGLEPQRSSENSTNVLRGTRLARKARISRIGEQTAAGATRSVSYCDENRASKPGFGVSSGSRSSSHASETDLQADCRILEQLEAAHLTHARQISKSTAESSEQAEGTHHAERIFKLAAESSEQIEPPSHARRSVRATMPSLGADPTELHVRRGWVGVDPAR